MMSLRLRRTAAAARELLIGFAAETWKADRALLTAINGSVVNTKTKESLELRQADPGPQAHQDRRR